MDNYFNLGKYSRPITTTAPEAQTWFDRGLNWCYAFHHEEALRCFQKVIKSDPNCAMGYWGIAYANGPNYNLPWIDMPPDIRLAVMNYSCENARHAQRLAAEVTPVEQALCQAIIARFPVPHVADAADDDTFAQWDDMYAQAMRDVYARFPQDNDVCALTAEALICRTPWQLWDLENRVAANGADTLEAITIFDTAFQRSATTGEEPHPGLLHFYIHTMEMSPEPEKALQAAEALQNLVPDAGHLIHMPSHIYILCGQYDKVVEANAQATIADEKYVALDDTINIYTIYRLHNIHFQIYGALFLGQYEAALRTANQIETVITPEGLHHELPWIADNMESFYAMKAHVFVRFGKWQAIIAEPLPNDPELFCVSTAYWLYAKGIAYAVLGDIDHAVETQKQFREALARVPEERRIYNNESRDTLAIAEAMLAGELEYRRQNYSEAFAHLRRSVNLYDNLNYAEPWAWMQPPRHALGALLLEQGHIVEASQVYRADLGLDDTLVRPSQHPRNIWSLHGYAECCQRLGQTAEAATIQAHLAMAQESADVTVNASCFCRQIDDCCH